MRQSTVLVLLSVTMAIALQAQDEKQAGFAVSLERRVTIARPGTEVGGTIRVVATGGTQKTRYVLEPRDLEQQSDGTVKPVPMGEGTRSCADWISVDEQIEIAAGGGTVLVPYTVSVPLDARGSYYGFISVRLDLDQDNRNQTAVVIQPSLSARLEIQVVGRKTLSLSVDSAIFDYNVGNGQAGVTLHIKNNGNAKTVFDGDVLLRSGSRMYPLRGTIMPNAQGDYPVIYPDVTRKISVPLNDMPRPGDYEVEVRLRLDKKWRTRTTFDLAIPERHRKNRASATLDTKAESDLDIAVEPAYVDLSLPPGATRIVPLTLRNRDTASVRMTASVVNVIQESNGFLTFGRPLATDSQWVKAAPSEFVLRPNGVQSIRLSVVAPDYGGRQSKMCAVNIVGEAGVDESNYLSEARLGVPVIAVPSGTEPAELELSRFDIVRVSEAQNPSAFVLDVKNTGGRTAHLVGEVVLERADNSQPVQTISFLESDGLIIAPGVTRNFRFSMPVLDRGEFRLKADVMQVDDPASSRRKEILFRCSKGPSN